jgi:hypothetical protein
MTTRRWAVIAATTAALVAGLLGVPSATAVPAAPTAPAPAVLDPSPPGSNNWSCRPSSAHPEPVVLVHGLSANQANNWSYLAPILAREGYCVFSLTYGRNPLAPPPLTTVGGLVPMEQSAQELKAFVQRVRSATGASKVDIVGHSEGSLMPDQYVRFLGGDQVVKRYIGMTPLWKGTQTLGLAQIDRVGRGFGVDPAYGPLIAAACGSCREFLTGSDFLKKLNSGTGPKAPGVTYTTVMTRYDELVVPYTSGRLAGATNIVLQGLCPTDVSEHAAVAYDPVNAQVVLNALDPADARPIRCVGPPR